ncbi:MAG: hypothetical protein QM696_12230 [Steroidobacteraceae bacterium]
MHSLEPEIEALHDQGAIDADAAARLAALESGRVFPLHRELQGVLYASVAAVVTGVGLLLRQHLDRIGPLTLLTAMLLAAALCYATAIRKALRHEERTLPGDYLLLLGALLLSSAMGYAELQFHWFGAGWSRHLLLLAAVHAFTAYALDSRLLLSVALTAFAAWMGLEARWDAVWSLRHTLPGTGFRALACAAVFLAARELHRRLARSRDFTEVFDHFAANFAFCGALALIFDPATRWWGALVLAALALYVGRRGYGQGRETFVLYAVGYAALGLWALVAQLVPGRLPAALLGLGLLIAATVLLFQLRARMKAQTA